MVPYLAIPTESLHAVGIASPVALSAFNLDGNGFCNEVEQGFEESVPAALVAENG